jgi:hypothetical protein
LCLRHPEGSFSAKRLPFLLILLCVSTALILPSCKKDDRLSLDPSFSINLVRPGKNYPSTKLIRKRLLSQAKIEIFENYGRPDFIRLWWTEDGRIQRYLEVDRRLKSILDQKQSWIYLDSDIEFVFDTEEKYRELPMTDKIRTICKLGDPEDVKTLSNSSPLKENWNYYSIGLILTFIDGKIVKKATHPPMGNIIKR